MGSSWAMDIFDIWNEHKRTLHQRDLPEFYIKEREIWYVKMGKNIGFEQNGKDSFMRPVLVLRKVGSLFLTVALTSKGKDRPYFHKFEDIMLDNTRYQDSSYAVLSQIKVMDKRRFMVRGGFVSEEEFTLIQKKLKRLFF